MSKNTVQKAAFAAKVSALGEIGLPELLVILLIALLVFGGKRLPEIARALGQAVQEFRKGVRGGEDAGEGPPKPEATSAYSSPPVKSD